ncbi:hypothetical protein FDP41_005600 [Naegleria fowleri]|uniref:Uncharacterized protein n=1 Tax=Naegleria fowleri TaxID=5763 RepID=A0A6A5BL40_NAEFO|nr:uncharacterized protein FDP41_005600 [Naegleria fowleri]KAF0975606.1 hypothetical protein FDP41_005600 [Naegleria fowleri]
MTCTSNEVVLALISKDTENKYFPKSIGTLDFFSVNVRNLSIFYLDRFGLLDSTSIQKESLDTLKDLGKIITYGDGQNKNILSVSQKDIHGGDSTSAWNVHFNYLRIKGSVFFPFLWTWIGTFTDEILKKKSKDGDSTSAPRILSLPVHYDNNPKEEKELLF